MNYIRLIHMHSYRADESTRRNVQVGVWIRSRSRRSSSELRRRRWESEPDSRSL